MSISFDPNLFSERQNDENEKKKLFEVLYKDRISREEELLSFGGEVNVSPKSVWGKISTFSCFLGIISTVSLKMKLN